VIDPILAALIALFPAALTWWWGRRHARLVDDPALPERLLANRARKSFATIVSAALLLATATDHLVWALPLVVIARMAAAYPLRKTLHRETWSLFGYLSFFTRLGFAAFGFWALLSLTPWLAMLAESRDWIVAGALAAILFVWAGANETIFRVVLRARAIDDPAIVSRFTAMVNACALPAVALERVDLRGGAFANAAALPSIRWPAVMVTSTLIERLDADETAAILGHELAHLEHYNPRRVRRRRALMYALVAGGALLSPVVRLTFPPAQLASLILWEIVLVAAIVLLARDRQKHETASDLRAIALAGDPDALVRALIKVHAFAYLPRRWDTEWERHATHPSLARRIQAIHAAAGTAPASLAEPATFVGADDASSVTFHDTLVSWSEGAAATHSIDYRRLTMLRIDVRRSGAPRLIAVDAAHRRWEMLLKPADVARAQATLDIVDTRLGVAAAPPAVSPLLLRVLALMVVVTAMAIDQFAAVVVAILAGLLPAPPLTAAAGASAVGVAALLLRDHSLWMIDWRPWTALALFACGALLAAVSFVNRRERTPPLAMKLIGVLAVGALAAWSAIPLFGMSAFDLHRSARAWPSAAVFALALGGALAFVRSRAARYSSVALTAAGLVAVFVGSTGFLHRFGNDPFLESSEPVTLRTVAAAESVEEFQVPFAVTDMLLSPAGRYVALASEDADEITTIHAGPVGAPLASFRADEAIFVDEGRLLLVERQRSASMLRLVSLERAGADVWSRRLAFAAYRLSLDRSSKTWHLFGSSETGEIVVASGTIGRDNVHEARWTKPAGDVRYLRALALSSDRVLATETRMSSLMSGSGPLLRLALLVESGYRTETRLWTIDGGGSAAFATSHLDLRCEGHHLDEKGTTCAAFDGTRTGFFAVDPGTLRLTPLASVTGRVYLRRDSGPGWFSGWWDNMAVLVRPATREAIHVAARTGGDPNQLARADKLVAAAWSNENDSTVRLYAIE
jgi:Zn-dependent protease with chaperone function